MSTLDLAWDVDGSRDVASMAARITMAIQADARSKVQRTAPDILDLFPLARFPRFQAHFSEHGWFALRVIFEHGLSMMVGPNMAKEDVEFLIRKIEPFRVRTPAELRNLLGEAWFAGDRLTYVGPFEAFRVSWPHIEAAITWWLSEVAGPIAFDHNRRRVMRAIPPPPVYDPSSIAASLWVLECDEDCLQGTAFSLEGVGLVTCAHALGRTTHAFRATDPGRKFPVEIIARHEVIDLAILRVPAPDTTLKRGDPAALSVMDHLLLAGHPNYRVGDTPVFVPGIVVGFRTVSGIRRILTNAAVVAGASGAPALNRDGRVIGVAVTGSKSFATAGETEDHALLPIDALALLAGR